jgi:adenosylcobinamide-phosphate synthase
MYLALGAHNLKQHALDVKQALIADNIELARKEVGLMVNHETNNMSRQDVISACLEAILGHGNDAIIAPIFWFIVFGAPGVVLYRLINILNTMWGYQSPRYKNFGEAATKANNVLNWLPARLAAFTYILLGDAKNGWQSFNEQAKTWNSPNDELVMASGAGALNLQIGGDVYCHGELKKRPKLGAGKPPDLSDITRASELVERGMIAWLAFTLVLSLLSR